VPLIDTAVPATDTTSRRRLTYEVWDMMAYPAGKVASPITPYTKVRVGLS